MGSNLKRGKDMRSIEKKAMVKNFYYSHSQNEVDETLSKKEQAILAMRYGFPSGIPKNMEQTGNVFGITRNHVRQIEDKIVKKIYKKFYEKQNLSSSKA